MQFSFTAISKLTLKHNQGEKTSKHVSTEIELEVSKPLDPTQYLKDGLPTEAGHQVLTKTLTQGLIANVHAAHNQNHIDSAQHLRDIIKELERGIFTVASVESSESIERDKKPEQSIFLKPIDNEEQYKIALDQLNEIFNSQKESEHYPIASALEILIEQYESKHYKIE